MPAERIVTVFTERPNAIRRWLAATFALAALLTSARGQTIEGQPIAAEFGEYQVADEGNGFSFAPNQCNVIGAGINFPAFTTGVPVKVWDPQPGFTEVSTQVTAFVTGSECAVSLGGLVHPHLASFYLTSGTGGLQEALNNVKVTPGITNTIILNAEWYSLIQPRSAATVIASVTGNASLGLVDITTNPYTSYSWNGTQYVVASEPGSGVTFPTTNGLICNTSPTSSRSATSTDVAGIIAGAAISPASLNGTVYAAGVNGAGIGVAQTAWSSSTAYPQCAAVASGGNNYLAVAASTNVTPGTNPSVWWQVPNAGTPTNGDCGFYMAASQVNGALGAELDLPAGNTNTCIGFMEPTVTSPGNPNVVIRGAGKSASTLTQTCNILSSGNAVVQQPDSGVPYALAGIDWEDFTVNANHLASAAMNVYGAQQFKIKHMRLENPADGSDHYIEFGHPAAADHAGAWTYEMDLEDIDTVNSHGPGTGASITATVSGGVPTFTVVNGGASYNPAYSQLILSGTGANADVPCSSRGTDTINVSGGVITSITTTATGCASPLYASVFGGNAVTYCFKFNDASDSEMIMALTPSECNTGVFNSNITSLMSFLKTHPIGTMTGIVDAGNNNFWATQMDTIYRYGFDFEGAANVENVYGSLFERATSLLPGSSDYHFGTIANSPINSPYAINIFGDACGTSATFNGYNHFLPSSGSVESGGGALPAFVHAYNSVSCDQTSSTANAPNYIGQNFSLSNGSAGGVFNFGLGSGTGGAISLTYPSNNGVYSWNYQNATAATSGSNSSSPQVQIGGNYWNGTASRPSYVQLQTLFGSGGNPTQTLQFTMGGTPSSGTKSYAFDNPIQLLGATSGSAYLSASATGGTLNLGSSNATVDSSGNLTVHSCAGCGSGGVTPSTQYQFPAYAAGGTSIAGSSITTDSTGSNLNVPGIFTLTNPTITAGQNSWFSQSNIDGCNPTTEFEAISGGNYDVAAVEGCVTSTTAPANQQLIGVAGFASTSGSGGLNAPIGGVLQGRALGSTGQAFGANIIAAGTTSMTSGGGLVGTEIDLSAQSPPSTFSGGIGLNIVGGSFYSGTAGTWPFAGVSISTFPQGSASAGTAQYFRTGLSFTQNSFGPGSTDIFAGAQGTAVSGANYACPYELLEAQESYWNGSAPANEAWSMSCNLATGTNPAYDYFLFSHRQGIGPTGQAHHFALDYNPQNTLVDLAFLTNVFTPTFSTIVPTAGASAVFTLPAASVTAVGYTALPTNGDCPSWVVSASVATLGDTGAPCGGGVTSFNTRTGSVTSASGDYTVSQVTGAAPLASPAFTGTPTVPTQAITTNNTDIATTAAVTTALSSYAATSSLGTFATQNYATPPAIGGTTPNAGSFSSLSSTGQLSNSAPAAASTPSALFSGSWFTAGSSTTNYGAMTLMPSGISPTGLSTSGTGLLIVTPAGFTGKEIDIHQGTGSSVFSVMNNGNISANQLALTNGISISTPFAVSIANANSSAATSSACATAGAVNLTGTYWTGTASASDTISLTPSCTAGTNGAETLTLANTGSSGGLTFANTGFEVESAAGIASTPGISITGAPYTGGTATTNFPQLYLNQGAAVTTLSTSGTEFGINAPSGFTGHLMNLFVNGGSTRFRVDYQGNTFVAGTETVASNFGLSSTAAPTIANGAGAGTSPGTPTVSGNNDAGVITVITGTATAASSTLATITFNGTLGTVPQGCGLTPRNAATTGATLFYTTAPTSTSFTIGVGSTAAAPSTTYSWSYLCL